jgi:hypothetical protein
VKFRLLIVALASVAMLSGCGKSTDSVRVDPGLDTSTPATPVGLHYVANEYDGTRYIEWNAVGAGDLAGYQVYAYNPTPDRDNAYEMIGQVINPANRYQLPDAPVGTTLTVRVTSYNNGGKTSGMSAPLTVTYEALRSGDINEVPGRRGSGTDQP